jgi:hypothetical protein
MTVETYPCACCGDAKHGHYALKSPKPDQLAFICDRCVGIIRLADGLATTTCCTMTEQEARTKVIASLDQLRAFQIILMDLDKYRREDAAGKYNHLYGAAQIAPTTEGAKP